MEVVIVLLYLIFAYLTYYRSQKYNGNPYLWSALGLVLPLFSFIIALIYFKKKTVADKRPDLVPPGFRSRRAWKMIVASLIYIMFTVTFATAVFNGQFYINSLRVISNKTGANNLKVHYIDVGQGDSILIQQGSSVMLIDSGTNASAKTVVNYLKKQGVKRIDYLVLTHPHEDHIGGADNVIKTFDIGRVYMPRVSANTITYRDVVSAMKNRGLKATAPEVGSSFKLGNADCMVLGPINTNSKDLNTYSIVIKLVYGNTSFLFTGDAQSSNERDMINKGFDLRADVLKVGHHGSYTSTSQEFLDKVKPKYAVISVGKDNDYGHPHEETMKRLEAMGIRVYRTDESGTIVCTSDGKNISFNCKPGGYKPGDIKSY